MSNPILVNSNLVNFTSIVPAVAGWKTVDLAPYINHPDPKMVVIVIMNGVGGSTKTVGCKPVGSALIDKYTALQTTIGIYQFPCSLAGGTTIQIYSPANKTGLNFFIHAEIGGDDAIVYDDPVLVNPGGFGWGTVDSTARLGADAGKVCSSILLVNHQPNGAYAYRSFGSTDAFLSASFAWGNTFGIVGLDTRDRYQVYVSASAGKTQVPISFYFEAGFIRRNYNHIENPVDRNLVVGGAWTNEDITDVTEGAASIALIRYYHIGTSGSRQAWMREVNAILQGPLWVQFTFAMHCLVSLTDSQVYAYYITDANVHQYILGWYANPRNIICIDSGEIREDTGIINLG